MKQFHFLCGLPRSGSTVLTSILNQNPAVYASPNSALVELLVNVRNHLRVTEQARAFMQPEQEHDVLRGIMLGMYHFTEKPVVIDKSRAWPHPENVALLNEVLPYQPKFIAVVRDLPSIMASFIQLIRNSTESSYIDKALFEAGRPLLHSERCDWLFSAGGTIYESWHSLKMAFAAGYQKQFHLIEYDDLVTDPSHTLKKLYAFLELKPYEHDLKHIINPVPEDDSVYSIPGMHSVRPKLEKTSLPAQEVLGVELYEKYAQVPLFWRRQSAVETAGSPNPFSIRV